MASDLLHVGNTGVLVSLRQISSEWSVPAHVLRRVFKAMGLPLMVTPEREYVSVPALETVLFALLMPGRSGIDLSGKKAYQDLIQRSQWLDVVKDSEFLNCFVGYSLAYMGGSVEKVRSNLRSLGAKIGKLSAGKPRRPSSDV